MAYSPEEAQAAVAGLVANPIPATSRQTIHSGGAFNSWDVRFIPGMPGRRYGDVRIEDQEAEPTNPGIREVTASTYGQTIPVSLGKRRLPGNIIQSTQMVPRLVGGRDYEITYQVPIYEDPPDDKPHSVSVNPGPDRPRPDPDNPPGKCKEDPCQPPNEPEDSGSDWKVYTNNTLGGAHCGSGGGISYGSQAAAEAAADTYVANNPTHCACVCPSDWDSAGDYVYQVCGEG